MAEAQFSFEFKGGSSFVFKDDLNTTSPKTNRRLTITFPNKSVLTFTDDFNVSYPTDPNGGFLGYGTSEILSVFSEWKELSTGQLIVNTDELRKDLQYYPEFFKDSAGNNAEFSYEYFPSGVYIVTYSFTTSDNTDSGVTTGYTKTLIIKMDQAANICLKRKIEWLFKSELESDTTQKEYDLVKNQILKLIMMMHIADFDFENEAYQEANLKLMSCDNICATGNLGYLYDSTRP
jgi:hypothetical protein